MTDNFQKDVINLANNFWSNTATFVNLLEKVETPHEDVIKQFVLEELFVRVANLKCTKFTCLLGLLARNSNCFLWFYFRVARPNADRKIRRIMMRIYASGNYELCTLFTFIYDQNTLFASFVNCRFCTSKCFIGPLFKTLKLQKICMPHFLHLDQNKNLKNWKNGLCI